jgi:hypothetical protein
MAWILNSKPRRPPSAVRPLPGAWLPTPTPRGSNSSFVRFIQKFRNDSKHIRFQGVHH